MKILKNQRQRKQAHIVLSVQLILTRQCLLSTHYTLPRDLAHSIQNKLRNISDHRSVISQLLDNASSFPFSKRKKKFICKFSQACSNPDSKLKRLVSKAKTLDTILDTKSASKTVKCENI